MADPAELGIIMRGYDEASGPMDAVEGRAGGLLNTLGKFGFAAFGVKTLAESVVGLARSFTSGNAEFERYETQFGVLLGGADAARARLAELAEFGAKTPFELPEVVRADKILQSFGLHSEESAKKFGMSGDKIRTVIGDVASGTGAGFEEITNLVGRFASGATGEAIMRFQELGITTREEMGKMGLVFSNSGQLMSPLPEAMDTVLKLMQKKYGGMMEAQSKTFEGMMSNLSDWIGQTKRKIMAPIFDVLKTQLSNVLVFLGSPAVAKSIDLFANLMAKGVGKAVEAVTSLVKSLSHLPISVSSVSRVVRGAADQVKSLVLVLKDWWTGSDEIEGHLANLSPAMQTISTILGKLTRAFSDVYAIALPLGKMIGEILLEDFKSMITLLSPLLELLSPLVTVLEGVATWVQKGADSLVFWNQGVVETTPNAQAFATIIARVLEVWLGILAAKKVVTFTQDIIHTGQQFIQGIKDAVQTITQIFKKEGKSVQEDWIEKMGEGWGKENVTQNITQKVTVEKVEVGKLDVKSLIIGIAKSLATGIAGAGAALFATSGVGASIMGGIGTALAAIPGVGWIILGALIVGALLAAVVLKFKDQLSRLTKAVWEWLKEV